MDMPTLAALVVLSGGTPAKVAAPRAVPHRAKAAAVTFVYATAPTGATLARDAFMDSLMGARVIAVGEKHDEPGHHLAQADVVAGVGDRDRNTVVGLEMVSQDLQPSLDSFMSGAMSESDFTSFWKKAWGYDYAMYKPIFDAAKARRLRVVGLNAPIALVSAVAKKGLAGLTPAQRAQLPASVAESSDARYRAFVKESLAGHKLPPEAEARMIEAQAVWNETMGAKVAELTASGARVVVVAGQGHMLWGAGVPESAARRGAGAAKVVLPYPLDGGTEPIPDQLRRLRDPQSGDLALADGFVLVP